MHMFRRQNRTFELPYNMALSYGPNPFLWPMPGEEGPGGIVYIANRRWAAGDTTGIQTWVQISKPRPDPKPSIDGARPEDV